MSALQLTTNYLGFELSSPLVASASPLTGNVANIARLEKAGAGAIVLPSLFEEQIEQASALPGGFMDDPIGAEAASGHQPFVPHLTDGPDHYLRLVEEAVGIASIPIIASLNGTTPGGWTIFASMLQDAGASAIELNIYRVAADGDVSGAEIEDHDLGLVADVRAAIDIPLAVKIGPHFSSIANMSRRLIDAGADGLVLFNRFYQPDIVLDDLTVAPRLALSDPHELAFVLRWMAILRGQLTGSLAATTGVHTSDDAVKCVLAGANVAMMTSALLKHGPEHVGTVLSGLTQWFTERGYESTDQARGSLSHRAIPNPEAFERANYADTLASFSGGHR